MEKELQQALVSVLQDLQKTVGQAKDLTIEQLPEVVHQYVWYSQVSTALWAVFCVATLAGAAMIVAKMAKSSHDSSMWLLMGVPAVVFGIPLASFIDTALMLWLAPKAWLLQSLAGWLK